ncbi:MAG: O-antigen ligase family protein [Thermoleophilaceae bacterium]
MNLPLVPRMGGARDVRVSSPGQLAAAGAIAAGMGLLSAATGSGMVAAGALGVLGLGAIGLVRPAAFLSVFLLTRPVLDSATDKHFSLGFATINAAGLFAVMLLAIFALTVSTSRSIVWPRATAALAIVFVLSIGAFYFAKTSWLAPFMGSGPLAELTRVMTLAAIYLLAANVMGSVARVRAIFIAVAFAALIPALVGLLQVAHVIGVSCDVCAESTQELGLSRINGTFVGPNPFGDYLALAILVLAALPRTLRLPPRVRLGLIGVLTVTLVATYSREAWAMALIGVAILFWRRRRGLMIGVAVGVSAAVLLVPTIHDRVIPSKETNAISPDGVNQFTSYAWRLETWRLVGQKIKAKPIQGYGLGTEAYLLPPLGSPEGTKGYEPHNLVLTTLLEGGVVLLLAYVFLFVVLLRRLRALSRVRWPLQDHARLLFVLWILVIIVGLLAGNTLSETATMFALFALTGAVEGAYARRGQAVPDGPRSESTGGAAR